ncbi:MAG: D-alanyl-D-alanine carboxypeptidase family protein [Blautia sp.]|jgi:D-alanyl-D-alanine carboxypeptidase
MKKSIGLLIGIIIGLQVSLTAAFAASLPKPAIKSQAAAVIDEETGEILFEKNGTVQCYPASITKLLTALVVAEKCDLAETVIFSHDAIYDVEAGSGNPIQLEAGDKLTVEECLYAMILESSNQAANALAEHVAGSLDAFAIYMDTKLDELGCKNSTFVNPSGLNDTDQLTTAEDMALIAKAAFENETVRTVCQAKTYQLPKTLNNPSGYELHMEHQLLNDDPRYQYPYAKAGKTGYTSAAGNTLVTSAKKDGHELIAVVLKSEQTHYEDTIRLFQYGFQYLEQQESQMATAAAGREKKVAAVQEPILDPEVDESVQPDESAGIGWAAKGALLVLGLLCLYGVYAYVKISRNRKRRIRARKNRNAREALQKSTGKNRHIRSQALRTD